MPKKKAPCKCLSIIMLDSVIKAKKKYYPQTILEECKYKPKKNGEFIDDDIEKGSSDESGSESDNNSNDDTESGNEKDHDQSNE